MPRLNLTYIFLLLSLTLQITPQDLLTLQQTNPESIFTTILIDDLTQKTPSITKIIFVVPWNSGKLYAIKYAHKFDYAVLCWFQVLFQKEQMLIQGENNYYHKTISELKAQNPKIKILLQLQILSSAKSIVQSIGSMQLKLKQAAKGMSSLCTKYPVDGLLFSSPFNLPLKIQPTSKQHQHIKLARLLCINLAHSIRQQLPRNKIVFYAIQNVFNQVENVQYEQLRKLKVDGFVVHALSNVHYEELALQARFFVTNMRNFVDRIKYFIVLPFFSRRQNNGINTVQVHNALKKYKIHKLRSGIIYRGIKNGICTFVQNKTNTMSYVPCFTYFWRMFQLVKEKNIGLGFWDAGSGLELYYSFL